MYGYNAQNTCCLIRRSNSATVPIANAAIPTVRKISKKATTIGGIKEFQQQRENHEDYESSVSHSDSEDSDAEFAVHECLRDLIKSRSVQAFQTKSKSLLDNRPVERTNIQSGI
ncbi:unnamed protein product [Enterobius vermicularis]|uniref:Uncharacterized protein n=1 Tax=Enterobius vermicularis TaxID=51028 RepID=A0A0N4VQK7_ENTVE|nr:unnamed protein product [Enterobius vermicularis]